MQRSLENVLKGLSNFDMNACKGIDLGATVVPFLMPVSAFYVHVNIVDCLLAPLNGRNVCWFICYMLCFIEVITRPRDVKVKVQTREIAISV